MEAPNDYVPTIAYYSKEEEEIIRQLKKKEASSHGGMTTLERWGLQHYSEMGKKSAEARARTAKTAKTKGKKGG